MDDRRLRAALLVTLASLTCVASASAQSTGGSAGSSGFGSGGGSSSSSSSSSSSGGSWSSSGSSGSSGSSAPEVINGASYTPPAAALGIALIGAPVRPVSSAEREAASLDQDRSGELLFAAGCPTYCIVSGGLIALALMLGRRKSGTAASSRGTWEVRRLSVAFDWTARAELQQALDELTRTTSYADDAGRNLLLRRVAARMRESLSAARYAMFQSFKVGPSEAEAQFLKSAADLRARFTKETRGMRAVGAAPEMRARTDEGQGLVVVSIVAAFDQHRKPLPRSMSAASLAAALESLRGSARVVAIEIAWSPAEDQDRMSSAELELFYPELLRVDATSTDIGRLCCVYCSAVYPAELGKCPACGAPAAA